MARKEKPDLLTLVAIKQTIEEHLNSKVDIVRYRERMNQVLKKRIDRDVHYAILNTAKWGK